MSSLKPDKHPGVEEELVAMMCCKHCDAPLGKQTYSMFESDNTAEAILVASPFGEAKYMTKEKVCVCKCSVWKIVANKPIWKEWNI